MKDILIILVLSILITGCNGQSEHKKITVPEIVKVKKTNKHIQLPGTRILIIPPNAEYKLIPTLIRLQKNENSYIQAVENNTNSFVDAKLNIREKIKYAQENQGLVEPYYQKEFQLGNCNAYVVYGPDNKQNLEQIVLLLGNYNYAVMISGVVKKGDNKTRDEILKSMLTSYVDEKSTPDYSALQNYNIDLSKSNYKFVGNTSQISYYTLNGIGHPEQNPFTNHFFTMTLPPFKNIELQKEYEVSLIQGYRNNGITISEYKEETIQVNNKDVSEISFTGKFQDKEMKVYQTVFNNKNGSVVFCGIACDNYTKNIEEFKKISKTIRLK